MSTPELVAPARPTVDDVAALIRARTKTASGEEIGTFTSETRPTDVQVQQLIILAEGDVLVQVGAKLWPETASEATSMIALRAACFVELSYWPEQIRTDRSAYEWLWRTYEAGMTALLAAIEAGAGEDGTGIADRFSMGTIPVRSWTQTSEHVFDEPIPVLTEAEAFALRDELLARRDALEPAED